VSYSSHPGHEALGGFRLADNLKISQAMIAARAELLDR